MEPVSLRIELGTSGTRIIEHLKLHNQDIEQQVQEGIELGLKELMDDPGFKRIVAEQTKKEIIDLVNKSVINWDIRQGIRQEIESRLTDKIKAHAEKLVEEITKNWD
jgi:hypothetical protein